MDCVYSRNCNSKQ